YPADSSPAGHRRIGPSQLSATAAIRSSASRNWSPLSTAQPSRWLRQSPAAVSCSFLLLYPRTLGGSTVGPLVLVVPAHEVDQVLDVLLTLGANFVPYLYRCHFLLCH